MKILSAMLAMILAVAAYSQETASSQQKATQKEERVEQSANFFEVKVSISGTYPGKPERRSLMFDTDGNGSLEVCILETTDNVSSWSQAWISVDVKLKVCDTNGNIIKTVARTVYPRQGEYSRENLNGAFITSKVVKVGGEDEFRSDLVVTTVNGQIVNIPVSRVSIKKVSENDIDKK